MQSFVIVATAISRLSEVHLFSHYLFSSLLVVWLVNEYCAYGDLMGYFASSVNTAHDSYATSTDPLARKSLSSGFDAWAAANV